jgi:hypothetical protein
MHLQFFPPFAQITNPDLGFQLSVCVNGTAEQLIMQALRSALATPIQVGGRPVVPVPLNTPLDTRATCSSNTERIGLWFPGAPPAGRDEALRLPSRLLPGENYVQQISLNGIRFVANSIWNDPATPKRIRLPNPFSDARLTGFTINLAPPDRIITVVSGFVPIAILPDVHFNVVFSDTVSLDAQGQLRCTPSNPQVNVTSSPLVSVLQNILVPLATAALGSAGSTEGLGCRVLRALAPGGVNVRLCGRVSFPYSRLDMDALGVTLGSRAPLAPCILAAQVQEEPFRAPR